MDLGGTGDGWARRSMRAVGANQDAAIGKTRTAGRGLSRPTLAMPARWRGGAGHHRMSQISS